RSGHGLVDFIRAISESCDVYFYKVGGGWAEDKIEGLGIARLAKWMELFGFGQRTGVELPGEVRGLIPSSDWKRINYGENWSTGDTYNAVFGQGYVLSTPLQMLNAINVIANGGHLYRPTLVDKILDGEGNVISDPLPDLIRTLPISPENLNLLRTGMRTAVTEGTLEGNIDVYGEVGIPIIDVPEGVTVAGKTGTAEYCDEIAYPKGLCVPGQWPTHSWTALYAPYENPEISVIAFVYNGGEGSKVAAPVASAILRAYFQLNESDSETSAPAPN
ncbi:MAG: penicillin-binding transpeptidase domain-containing protein, partial [Anaerolineales bacterium]